MRASTERRCISAIPPALGIEDLGRPDVGGAVTAQESEVPVFWTCVVTPQAAVMASRPGTCSSPICGTATSSCLDSRSAWTIDVGAVRDSNDDQLIVAHNEENPIVPTAGTPPTFEFAAQRFTQSERVPRERGGHELHDSRSDALGEPFKMTLCARCEPNGDHNSP